MAASSKTDICDANNLVMSKSQASSKLTTNFDDGNFVFHSKLPNGLAIRSVGIVNDVPEIRLVQLKMYQQSRKKTLLLFLD